MFARRILPDNTTGSYQAVTQVVPVKILILDRQGLALVPGLNATVRIRR
jgi:multidrug resistance efflux pump